MPTSLVLAPFLALAGLAAGPARRAAPSPKVRPGVEFGVQRGAGRDDGALTLGLRDQLGLTTIGDSSAHLLPSEIWTWRPST
ncbi:MAG TPA: hypothetical protein VNJ71_13860 [Gemmatimonadales bacterium]|jgi:hypothetical protein|nr:hypothetical protein [Gemmatimonadales bacterium]